MVPLTQTSFMSLILQATLLGGGDGVPFSGDEGLQYTGYYATWNTLITLNGITAGVKPLQWEEH